MSRYLKSFKRSGSAHFAVLGGAAIHIKPDAEGWWTVYFNGRPVEDFEPNQLAQAKRFAIVRYA